MLATRAGRAFSSLEGFRQCHPHLSCHATTQCASVAFIVFIQPFLKFTYIYVHCTAIRFPYIVILNKKRPDKYILAQPHFLIIFHIFSGQSSSNRGGLSSRHNRGRCEVRLPLRLWRCLRRSRLWLDPLLVALGRGTSLHRSGRKTISRKSP